MSAWFITGTDTGCGKTAVTEALLNALKPHGSVCGYKPIAAGCEKTAEGWRNEDALILQAASSGSPEYSAVNPYALAPAIAPHIAAQQAGTAISTEKVQQGFAALQAQYDFVLTEGAGGWRVPLSVEENSWMSDLPAQLGTPVILVVGIKLGCINHALLTAESIIASGNRLAGWVANSVTPAMEAETENLKTLQLALSEQLKIPLIAQFGYQQQSPLQPQSINLSPLFGA